MHLDIRVPMALMFGLLGAILAVYGMLNGSHPEIQQRSLGININLWWGIVMIVFAIAMYAWSRTGKSDAPRDEDRRK